MGTGQRPGLGPAGDCSEADSTVTGSRPARPHRPRRLRDGAPPPRARFLRGTFSALPQAARESAELSAPSRGEQRRSRRSFPLRPGREDERRRGGPALGPRAALTSPSGSEQAEPGSKLPAPPPQTARRAPAHFAPDVSGFRLAAPRGNRPIPSRRGTCPRPLGLPGRGHHALLRKHVS